MKTLRLALILLVAMTLLYVATYVLIHNEWPRWW